MMKEITDGEYRRIYANKLSIDGTEDPFSHLETACVEIKSLFAICS